MKKLLLILSLGIVSLQCYSQIVLSGGLLGGITIGSVKVKNIGNAIGNTIEGDNIYGFEGGIYAKLLIKPFYIRPALLYNYRNGEVTYTTQNDGKQTTTFSSHKIEIPVLVGFKVIGPLHLEAGPVYHYIFDLTEHYGSADLSLGRNGLGYRVGAMLELGPVLTGVSYQGALYGSGTAARVEEPHVIKLSLGIRLGTTKDEKE